MTAEDHRSDPADPKDPHADPESGPGAPEEPATPTAPEGETPTGEPRLNERGPVYEECAVPSTRSERAEPPAGGTR